MTKGAGPLRVVHVIGGLQLGGAETLLYRLATAPSEGFRHEVICLGTRDWYSAPLEQHGVAVHHLEMMSAWSAVRRLRGLKRVLRELRPDVIQSWMYLANVASGLSARGMGVPVVWGIHAATFQRLSLASRICAFAGGLCARRLADFIINCSNRSAQIHSRVGYAAAPGAVIPNGYDSLKLFPDVEARAATRAKLGIEDGAFVIGSVTRWHPDKDVPAILEAVARLQDRRVPVHCLLVGGGLELSNPELAQAINRAGVTSEVQALGLRGDVPDLARALDLHILSSRSEAFPNVVAETMLSGTPNVVTDVGDAALMVGDAGWVVPPRDPLRLADAIEQAYREWSDRKADWERRRTAARNRIAEQFTFDRMAAAYQDVWRRLARRA